MADGTCSAGDCDKPAKTGGRCAGHAERLRLKGIDGGPLLPRSARPARCTQPECDRPVRARGLCSTHYARWHASSEYDGPIGEPGRRPLPRVKCSCRDCGCVVERLNPHLYVLCPNCLRKPRKSRGKYYGKSWVAARELVRARDLNTCRSCGRPEKAGTRRHAVAHVVPFDVGVAAGWPEEQSHHPANLLLLCQPCHIAYDRRPGWAYDVRTKSRPGAPQWASEYRVSDLVSYLARFHEDAMRAELKARRREQRSGQLRLIEGTI